MTKGPKFTNKSKEYSTRFIGAGKKPDGQYESEEECLARVKDLFDIEDVPCIWDEDRKGFVPYDGKSEVEDETQEDKSVVATAEEVIEVDEDRVVEVKLDEESDHTEDMQPEPSDDGLRAYDLSASQGAPDLQSIIDKWSWDFPEEELIDKLLEEAGEAKEGTRDVLELEDTTLKVIGLSADSEMITVGCIVFKWLNMHGLNVANALKAMALRNQEQFDRYQSLDKD